MAAVISFPHPTLDQTGAAAHGRRSVGLADQPHLVVLEGGRSSQRRQMARTYAVRRAVALLAFAMAACAVVMLAIGLVRAVQVPAAAVGVPMSYVVEPGDTLWGIARGFDLDVDIRIVVDELAAANGGSTIRPGQRLAIPSSIGEL